MSFRAVQTRSREIRLNHSHRAMKKIGRRKTFRYDVTRLHELDGKLVDVGVNQTSANNQTMVDKPIALDEVLNLGFQFQTAASQFGQLPELLETLTLLQEQPASET